MLAVALQAEVDEHVDQFRTVVDADGMRRVVRNGYLPEREIQTGAGKLVIKQPRVRVKGHGADDEELIPWLYLRGISTNDMEDALSALLGVNAVGLPPGIGNRV